MPSGPAALCILILARRDSTSAGSMMKSDVSSGVIGDDVFGLSGGRSADMETKKLLSDSARVRCE